MKFDFTVVNKRDGELRFVMDRSPFNLGRLENCDFQLNSRTVSRQHCELKLKRVGLTVMDLGSRNGTLINGELAPPGTRVPIRPGDILQIGKYTVRVGDVLQSTCDAGEQESNTPAIRSQTAVMASLEKLVAENIDSSTEFSENVSSETGNRAPVTWKTLHPATDAPKRPKPNKIANESDELLISSGNTESDNTISDEVITTVCGDDSNVDAAEKRRLELRARIEAMKAKDSKEAANRALKNFFNSR